MYKKLIYLVVFALTLGLVSRTSADLVGHWRLDEGSGTMVYDSSGNNNNGTIHGAKWDAGKYGQALQFNGQDNYVEVPTSDSLEIDTNVTIAAWIYWIDAGDGWQGILSKGPMSGPGENYSLFVNRDGRFFHFVLALNVGRVQQNSPNNSVVPNEWQHVCCTWDGSVTRIYITGEVAMEMDQVATIIPSTLPLRIGHREGSSHYWNGIIDEVRVYDHALMGAEILAAMEGSEGYPHALAPNPKDGDLHEDTWVTLSWLPGDFAVSHDVYLGESFDGVNDATNESETFRGNQTTTFYVAGFPGFAYPDGLVPGMTYYWRIDEVNEADPNSPWKGDVWSFSIPPKKAYNPDPTDGAEILDPNSVTLSWTPGFEAILHTVYFGDNYDEVTNATVGNPAGTAFYSPGPLESEKVYYWRIDEFDGVATYKGDVWTFTTPGAVGNPQPPNGATDVAMATILSWTPADNAASHQIYFGLDKEAVRSADAGAPEYKGSVALGAESYDPGLLEAKATYYWRVDGVYAGNPVEGPVWSFTVGDYLLVDDFESYTDDDAAGEAVWQHWIDGFGVVDNGSQAGNVIPPYCEQTIVHGGSQSMPLLYANEAGVTNSEAALTLTTPRDWTTAGVGELSLWFRGDSANAAEPLYLAISNSGGAPAIVANDDSEAALARGWEEWRVPLQAFADQGINLTDVDKIAIGLGSKSGMAVVGGSGMMYIDDIRLH